MNQIPVTIRIEQAQLDAIDLYANEHNTNRSSLLRNCISSMIADINKQRLKDKLIAASKKVSSNSLSENIDFELTIEDGITNVK